jgi:hypothetical protein
MRSFEEPHKEAVESQGLRIRDAEEFEGFTFG